ncbi:MAG TPA: SycD/LcrH family type III secretion system chaperone [Usitatibacter sp.]|nr:SycD/LcrH family type III secretion system chaperone [Usitatibacter sp.]
MEDTNRMFGKFVAELEGLASSKRFSPEELEAVYALAHGLFASGKFDEALKYFGFLTLYRPTDPKYLLGLAASQQMARQFEAAIQTYSFLTLLDPSDPGPTLRIGECLMMLGQAGEARDSFTMVIAMANVSGGQHAALKARAEGLLAALSQSPAKPGVAAPASARV